jgi:hypothetical protein
MKSNKPLFQQLGGNGSAGGGDPAMKEMPANIADSTLKTAVAAETGQPDEVKTETAIVGDPPGANEAIQS